MQSETAEVKAALSDRLSRLVSRGFGAVLDRLYPPVCLSCAAPIGDADALCVACWRGLQPITPPLCPVLGLPFAVPMGEGVRSAEAIADPPPFSRARAAVLYGEVPRALVGRLKYGDRPEIARFCGRMMAAAGAELLEGSPVLVPVPLHRRRQWQRRYNQSTELARAVARIAGVEMAPMLVMRTRPTRPQVGLSAGERARNLAGAFAVDAERAAPIAGRRIVVIDDVVTTGSTAGAVTRALQRAGFADVDVLSFARVAGGEQRPI